MDMTEEEGIALRNRLMRLDCPWALSTESTGLRTAETTKAAREYYHAVRFARLWQLIEKYPHSQYVGDAQQRMGYLRNRLADFELHVALYYMRRGAYVGALNRAKYCVENYDGAPAVKGSMRVMVAAYYDLNMVDLAKNAERVYADNYPGPLKDLEPKKHWYQRIL